MVIAVTFFIFGFVKDVGADSNIPPTTEEILTAGQHGGQLDPSVATSALPEVLPDVKPLDLTHPPTTEEIMAAGQLGGLLYPTYDVTETKKKEEYNLSFGIAIQEWNAHEYDSAVELFKQHIDYYPDSPWVAEAMLHIGCESQYSGRYTEAEEWYKLILDVNKDGTYEGAKRLVNKARLRLGTLKVSQYNFDEAFEIFGTLFREGSDWRDRTYASHWIQRISRYSSDKLAMLNCGTKALAHLLEKEGKIAEARKVMEIQPETVQGHSIKALTDIASQYGYNCVAIKISPSELKDLPLPAIMQISAKNPGDGGHYWILDKVEGDRVELFDPQSKDRFHQTLKEFSKEWSGTALVISNKKKLPGTKLSESEMAESYGACCGTPRATDHLGDPCRNKGPDKFNSCGPLGSPTWSVDMINMNLYVNDIPLWYRNAIGPSVTISLSYNSQSSTNYHEPFGNKWQFNYGTFLVVNPDNKVNIYMPDGRIDIYTPSGSAYIHPPQVFNTLTKMDTNHYELKFPDGTIYVYNVPAGSQQVFLTEIRDSHGKKLTFEYDTQNPDRLVKIKDALNRETTLTYNAQGLVERVTDPFNPSSRYAFFEYDGSENLTRTTDMGGHWSSFTYDGTVYLTSIVKETGTWGFYIEPADGDQTCITQGGQTVCPSDNYMPPGCSEDLNCGVWQSYRMTITNPLGHKEEYFYEGGSGGTGGISGCPCSWYVAPKHYVDYIDNDHNNFVNTPPVPKTVYLRTGDDITKITDPEGNSVSFGYTSGSLTSIQDGNGHTTTLTHDPATDYITKITDPLDHTVKFTYNGENKLTKMEFPYPESDPPDPRNYVYLYEYLDGNLSKIKYPDYPNNGETAFEYTLNQPTKLTDPEGTFYNFEYDSLGYHTGTYINWHAGGTQDSYVPNAFGRITSHTDRNKNIISYGYDDLDRIETVTYPGNPGFVKQYTYDCCRLESVTSNDGSTSLPFPLRFTYNNANRLTDVRDVYDKPIHYEYNQSGNLTSITYPGNKTVTYEYDDADRLITVTDWLNNVTSYEYDPAGNLIKKIYPNGSNIINEYDDANRLTGVLDYNPPNLTVNSTFNYTLDALGNREEISFYQPLDVMPSPQALNCTYGYDNRLLETYGSTTYTSDANGNLISKTGGSPATYTWYYNNILTDVAVSGGNTYHYKYDGLGNRVSKRVNTTETRYIVDPLGSRVLAEIDGSGTITAYYVYGHGLLSKITPSGQAYYYHYDGLGSTIAITDLSGAIKNKYAYDTYGKVLNQVEDPQVPNPFKYIGEYGVMDDGNGLLYMRARYYDPEVGRFINKDPIGFGGGDLNLYAYAGNNPVNFVDPVGLRCACSQSTGQMTCVNDQTGQIYYNETGYSGTGAGRNNPDMQDIPNTGPIPRGSWQMGSPYDSPNTGRNTITLTPLQGNECFDTERDCNSFRVHGNNARNDASLGCIILPPNRTQIPQGEIVDVVR
jgi:RHS repeat-associated protein